MTSNKPVDAARRQGQFSRDRVSRRLTLATTARRRLNGRRTSAARIGASQFGPPDPRYEYLTHAQIGTGSGAGSDANYTCGQYEQ